MHIVLEKIGGIVKKILFICLVVIIFTGCAVNKSYVDSIEARLGDTEQTVAQLQEQLRVMDLNRMNILNDQMQSLHNRITALEGRAVANEPANTPVAHIPGSIMDDEVNTLYREAYRLYETRDYPQAIRLFTRITQQAPRHDLAANSHYWIGECFYAMADFSAARLAFQNVVDQYPDSNKFIDALVKIAMTWIRQNEKNQARTILLAIKRDYPTYERMSVVDQNLRLTQ